MFYLLKYLYDEELIVIDKLIIGTSQLWTEW